ncbi:hypothetical protein ACWG8W_06440 [Citricoccus zhacaiensis]
MSEFVSRTLAAYHEAIEDSETNGYSADAFTKAWTNASLLMAYTCDHEPANDKFEPLDEPELLTAATTEKFLATSKAYEALVSAHGGADAEDARLDWEQAEMHLLNNDYAVAGE